MGVFSIRSASDNFCNDFPSEATCGLPRTTCRNAANQFEKHWTRGEIPCL
jgi:hypothetical protein